MKKESLSGYLLRKERVKPMPKFNFPILLLLYTASEATFLKAKESKQQLVDKKARKKQTCADEERQARGSMTRRC